MARLDFSGLLNNGTDKAIVGEGIEPSERRGSGRSRILGAA